MAAPEVVIGGVVAEATHPAPADMTPDERAFLRSHGVDAPEPTGGQL